MDHIAEHFKHIQNDFVTLIFFQIHDGQFTFRFDIHRDRFYVDRKCLDRND